MQKRKFDELISHFNRKVSDMSIDQKYKMELLGMISAIGFAHEKELSTNLASLGTDCISRQAAIDALIEYGNGRAVFISVGEAVIRIEQLPPIQPEQTNCDYCHEDVDGYVKPIEKNNHAFVRFGMDGWELSLKAKGWHGSAKIRYCPMCGRELKHG